MTPWNEFEHMLRQRHPNVIIQSEPGLGSANSARFLVDGFKAGIPNLRGRSKVHAAIHGTVPWAYAARVLVPGLHDTEIYLALIFSGKNLLSLERRLQELDAQSQPGKSAPTNNTRFLLHRSGFYATVMQESDRIAPESAPESYGAPLAVDEIVYADVERGGRLTPAEVDVIARLRRDYPEPERIVRLEPGGIIIKPVRRPEQLSLSELKDRTRDLGGYYSDETLEAFHLNLTHNPQKHFVILRGISGTGKSRLAKCYAYAVLGADSLNESHDRFVVVPVEPQWTDPTHLLGYEDVLSEEGYRRTVFLDALLLATSDPLQPVFVLLDEMNRAQVEHYFAPLLSAMEIEGVIRLRGSGSRSADQAGTGVPREIPWPTNLYLIGTINDDESVIPFSAMVLDRANSQDLSHTDTTAYANWLRAREPALAPALSTQVISKIQAISTALAPFQLHFGNRTVREIALYLTSAANSTAGINALDHQIDQKILPKLRGGEECAKMLNDLITLLDGYPISRNRVKLMKSDLDNIDFFKYR